MPLPFVVVKAVSCLASGLDQCDGTLILNLKKRITALMQPC